MEAKLRPLTNLIYDTWKMFMDHIAKLLALVFLPQVANFILLLIFWYSLAALSDTAISNLAWTLVVALMAVIISAIQLLVYMSLVVYTVHHKKRPTIMETYRLCFKQFWQFLWLNLIIFFFGFIILAIGAGIIVLVIGFGGIEDRVSLANIFYWLLFIPTLGSAFYYIYVMFANYILIDKKLPVWKSFLENFNLLQGQYWPTALRVATYFIIAFAATLVLSLLPVFGQLIIALLIPPTAAVYLYLIYQDLVKKK